MASLQATKQIDPSEGEVVVEKVMSLESPTLTPGLQACVEHVEDGLALATDAVIDLEIDSSTQGLLFDRLTAPGQARPKLD